MPRRAVHRFVRALAVLACCAGTAGIAQEQGSGQPATGATVQDVPRAPVLVVDRNRLFVESAFGRAAEARFQAESQDLIAENLRLEQALEAEERALTDQRATLEPAAFQKLAADFDAKTEAIRTAQDAKSRALTATRDEDRQRFLQAAVPILGEIMREAGAVAIFDKDMVILSLRGVDITEEAIALIDAQLGDGSSLAAPGAAVEEGSGVAPSPANPEGGADPSP